MIVPSSREVLTEQAGRLQRWDNERLPLEYSDRYAIRGTLDRTLLKAVG